MNRELRIVIFKGDEHIIGAYSADYVVEFRIALSANVTAAQLRRNVLW